MKIMTVICLLLVSLLAISPLGAVLAQEGEEPQYALSLTPSDGRYNTTVVAGRTNDFRVELENLGEATIDKITLAAEIPDGWTIKFDPPRLASLAVFDSKRIYATIGVPEGAETGDYMVSLSASGEQASAEKIDIRVTVKIPVKVEKIEMRAVHPRVEAIAGADFVFEVEFKCSGGEFMGKSRSFDLVTTAPQGWKVYMTPQYEKEKRISAIDLQATGFTYGDKTRVVARAPFWPLPEPGEYKITVEAVSGDLKDSVELTAVITVRYHLLLAPSGERYNTTATAGKDNYFSIDIGNLGTAPLDKINFSSEKPEGWIIEFSPEKIDLLEAIHSQNIVINIKPPPKTIAGDYVVTIRALATKTTSRELNIRVTVETPTVWGWVQSTVIILLIVGLVIIFMRFRRRQLIHLIM